MVKKFITPFTRTVESVKDSNVVKFTQPSKVKKSLAYATDINKIYQDYCRTGHLPLNGQQPLYDENFVKYDSLVEAQKLVNDATLYFNSLPATVKNQYGNSLERFVIAVNNCDDFLIQNGVLNVPTSPVHSPFTDKVVFEKPTVSDVKTDIKTDLNVDVVNPPSESV